VTPPHPFMFLRFLDLVLPRPLRTAHPSLEIHRFEPSEDPSEALAEVTLAKSTGPNTRLTAAVLYGVMTSFAARLRLEECGPRASFSGTSTMSA